VNFIHLLLTELTELEVKFEPLKVVIAQFSSSYIITLPFFKRSSIKGHHDHYESRKK
jgi:hypothetical protein